jgi:hypothetical protein
VRTESYENQFQFSHLQGVVHPVALVEGRRRVTVRFEAVEGGQIATVLALRMIRGEAPR